MPKIKIVTDSTAYLKKQDIDKYSIKIVPLSVTLDNENFKEDTKSHEEFFTQLKKSKGFPTTSQPSIGDFHKAYTEILNEYDEIISIHISELISGTMHSASTAASEIGSDNISIFDSATTAAALEDMVLTAAEMASSGHSREEIINKLNYIKNSNRLLFMVDNLKYLHKGGRIGKAGSILGTILQIKPILYIRGEVGLFDKVRTHKKALQRIIQEVETVANENGGINNIKISIIQVHNEQGLRELEMLLKEKWPEVEYETSSCGPVIGSHVGPGGLGLTFRPK
ncbi:DegV family protein [Desulfitibacter alkalitolerans]|uniref:DegV family protein n=1 Tax=Desulfitibacter alkalitolerans TaxID=264641 RepID=UPI000481564B|nr:DegV family protein [Desulfitibacter alkalitolerans]